MKRILKIAALALVIVLGSSLQNKTSAQDYNDRGVVTYQTFYDELSPYGQWVDYPNYGYVWVPDAGPDFRPYSTNGHWVYTDDYEWMWVSDYDWGWGPFHYGRWEEDNDYGWFWVPGYEWSPAWVAWRDGGDYYGWAPLRPGINISINFNIGGYSPPYDYWSFAPRRYITSPRIFDYCVDRRQNVTIINYTTIIINNNNRYSTNYGFRSGPSRYEAERYCGRINPVRFRDSYNPGRTQFRNNEVSFYRPNVRQDNNRREAPRQFQRYENRGDNRTARNDNGFRRNDNNVNDRTNNRVPDRNNNNDFRQPRNNDNNNGQTNRPTDNRISRPTDRVDRNTNPGNDNNNRRWERPNDNNSTRNTPVRQQVPGNNDQQQLRQFERRQQDVRSNDQPQRLPQQMERRQEQQQPRQFERRQQDVRSNDQPQRQPQQQMERRQEQQQQPRQFERRQQDVRSNDQPQRQPQQQMERRQEPPTRQLERRDDANRQQNTGDRNHGNGNKKNRF